MLDLDNLAEKYAGKLNEKLDQWRTLLWSADFQRLSKNMSDGEVESVLANCCSSAVLYSLLEYLGTSSIANETAPYSRMNREAKQAGLSLADWITSLHKR